MVQQSIWTVVKYPRSSQPIAEGGLRLEFALSAKTLCRKWVIFDRDEASSRSRHVRCALKAEVKSGYWHLPRWAFAS